MQEKDAQRLLEKFRAGECTEEEKIQLRNWFNTIDSQQEAGLTAEELDTVSQEMWAHLESRTQPIPVRRLWSRIAGAAAVLIIAGLSGYFLKQRNAIPATNDVQPFTAMAILKTHGRTIQLDKTQNGKIAQTAITKSAGEQLAYATGTENRAAPIYDTIQIPAGGRPYTIKLSDGSKITLNAATTLRYPEAFSPNRIEQVELITGEIYAEIVHDENAPLQIKAPGQVITDIGTEFNISAYPDEEDSRTTLVAGKVKVSASHTTKNLAPGEQAILIANNLLVTTVNIQQVTAWKDGFFRFNGEHIDVIMRQLARWYNIEVKYEGRMTNEVFYGKVTRKRNISQVLKMLEKTQKIHFKVEGRRVTVLSK
ncbi:MAG: FecR family protein [Mucilaginibacter sp.]|nr:FecR family protein [Mucilaginibacter sp.]